MTDFHAFAGDTWRPFGMDEGDAASTYDALVEGVPPWMYASLRQWLVPRFTRVATISTLGRSHRETRLDLPKFRQAERVLRVASGWDGSLTGYAGAVISLWDAASKQDPLILIDYALSVDCPDTSHHVAVALEGCLHESGSAFRVGTRAGKTGLIRRVPLGVQVAADHVMQSASKSGSQLAQAWERAFGISPDPSSAYRMAVKAVESAAIPLVQPNNPEATLGTVIAQMNSDRDWRLPFLREHTATPTNELLLHMLRTLWRGQHDRHGGTSELPPEVTAEEAEAAVTMSVTLVHWFTSGSVARRRAEPSQA